MLENRMLYVSLMLVVGGALNALWMFPLVMFRVNKLEASVVKLYEKLDELRKEYVSHTYCDLARKSKNP